LSMNIAVVLDPEAVATFADILPFFQESVAPVRLTLFGLCPASDKITCSPLEKLAPEDFDLVLDLRSPGAVSPELHCVIQGKVLSGQASRAMAEVLRNLANLLRDQEIHKGILDSATDAIVTIDEDHVIVGYNRGAEKIFGYSREEALGQDLKIIIPSPYKEQHRDFVRRYIATRSPHVMGKHVQLSAQRRDGSEFPMSISFSMADIRDELYFTGIVRDITEYKQMEDRLVRAQRLAAVGNTVSHIAHEIKNPLAIIGGFAQQLQKIPGLDEKNQHKLGIIMEEVRRLEDMIAQMRDFVKHPSITREPGNLDLLLDEVVEMFEAVLQEQNVTLKRERAPENPALSFDPKQIRQVLINLFKNALEVMPHGGELTVISRVREQNLEVSIGDTGQGMTPEVKANIFQPYFTTKEKGTGLGLAISQSILEEHGGGIAVESAPGAGSTFTIQIPLQEAPAP
jgi:two-component system, LuxR family, sensor kinase FixL